MIRKSSTNPEIAIVHIRPKRKWSDDNTMFFLVCDRDIIKFMYIFFKKI